MLRAPLHILDKSTFGHRDHLASGDDQMIDDPDVEERQCFGEPFGDGFIRPAGSPLRPIAPTSSNRSYCSEPAKGGASSRLAAKHTCTPPGRRGSPRPSATSTHTGYPTGPCSGALPPA